MAEVGVKSETREVQLKSAPPDGFVEIRKFGYGETLKIRGMSARLKMDMRERRSAGDEQQEGELQFEMEKVNAYKFEKAIVKHNLTINGRPVNFKNRADFAALDPAVGAEIEKAIDEHNPDVGVDESGDDGSAPLGSESSMPSGDQPAVSTSD